MTTTSTRAKFLTVAAASVAAPALLFLGAGTAQAIQDVNEVAPGVTVGAFNPQPGTPGVDDPGIKVGIDDPGIKIGIRGPGIKVAIGGPDTRPGH